MTGQDYRNERLVELRGEKGLTRSAVARRIGKTRMVIHLAETGKGPISFHVLKSLADLYCVPVKSLLRDESQSPESFSSQNVNMS